MLHLYEFLFLLLDEQCQMLLDQRMSIFQQQMNDLILVQCLIQLKQLRLEWYLNHNMDRKMVYPGTNLLT